MIRSFSMPVSVTRPANGQQLAIHVGTGLHQGGPDRADSVADPLRDRFETSAPSKYSTDGLGYSDQQRQDLAETIAASGAEVVLDASPCRLDRLLKLSLPMVRVRYGFEQLTGPPLVDWVLSLLEARRKLPG